MYTEISKEKYKSFLLEDNSTTTFAEGQAIVEPIASSINSNSDVGLHKGALASSINLHLMFYLKLVVCHAIFETVYICFLQNINDYNNKIVSRYMHVFIN